MQKTGTTVRQKLVDAAVRECVVYSWTPSSAVLAAWLDGPVARCVAEGNVPDFNFPRFVSEVRGRTKRAKWRRDWMAALRVGVP
jgi:hypothetical protein